MAVSTSVATIREAWFQLNGVMCIYKPTKISWKQLRNTLAFNICRGIYRKSLVDKNVDINTMFIYILDINQLEETPPRKFVNIESITPDNQLDGELVAPTSYGVTTTTNLTDHKLVRGPAIQLDDIRLFHANRTGYNTSGVLGRHA
jgi:hypothetical protein